MYELIEKAKKGSKEAFTELIKNMEKDLYKIAKARLKNDEDIADAFQETVIIAFKFIKKLKNIEYFKTWIIKILINNCNAIYRKNNQKEISFEEMQFENYIANDNLEDINDNLNFNNIISHLNYDERIALTLYYAEGDTNKEIGKILNTNENTVKARISRAKNKILKISMEERNNG